MMSLILLSIAVMVREQIKNKPLNLRSFLPLFLSWIPFVREVKVRKISSKRSSIRKLSLIYNLYVISNMMSLILLSIAVMVREKIAWWHATIYLVRPWPTYLLAAIKLPRPLPRQPWLPTILPIHRSTILIYLYPLLSVWLTLQLVCATFFYCLVFFYL